MHEEVVFKICTFLKITERSSIQLSHLFHDHQPYHRTYSFKKSLISKHVSTNFS